MRFCLLLLPLLACSGGGGSRPFTPSSDILATHPHLLGNWVGEVRSHQATTPFPATATFRIPAPGNLGPGYFETVVALTGACLSNANGQIQADGNRVVFVNHWASHTDWRAECTLQGTSLVGTYRVEGPLCGVDTGTVELHKVAPLSIEVQTVVEWR